MTQEEYLVQLQNASEVYVKTRLMDWDEHIIGEMQGVTLDGSLDIDADSSIRRNVSLKMAMIDNTMIPSPTSKIWLNKKFQLFIGLKNNITQEIVWFEQGIFILDSPSLDYSNDSHELSIKGLDKMCMLNGQISGQLNHKTERPVDVPLFDTIKLTVEIGDKKSKIIINDVDGMKLPYTIEKSETDTVESVLKEERDLYFYYEFFYSKQGNFIYQKIKDRKYDIPKWNFDETNLVLNYSNQPNWENVKNDIYVWGATLDDGTQIQYHIENNDKNSPFSIVNIGRRTLTITDEKILDNIQCKTRTEYEMYLHSSLLEKVSFNCVPIYNLNVNELVELSCKEIGIEGRYRIEKISLPLTIDGSASISAVKVYYEN